MAFRQFQQRDEFLTKVKKEAKQNDDLKFGNVKTTRESIAAGTSSSGTGAPHKQPMSQAQFMIDDIRLFRDFVLFYNKNRFKKYKHKPMTDHLFLNQPQITDHSIGLDLYYKLREHKNVQGQVYQVSSKI